MKLEETRESSQQVSRCDVTSWEWMKPENKTMRVSMTGLGVNMSLRSHGIGWQDNPFLLRCRNFTILGSDPFTDILFFICMWYLFTRLFVFPWYGISCWVCENNSSYHQHHKHQHHHHNNNNGLGRSWNNTQTATKDGIAKLSPTIPRLLWRGRECRQNKRVICDRGMGREAGYVAKRINNGIWRRRGQYSRPSRPVAHTSPQVRGTVKALFRRMVCWLRNCST